MASSQATTNTTPKDGDIVSWGKGITSEVKERYKLVLRNASERFEEIWGSVCGKETESFFLSVKRTHLQAIILPEGMKGDEDKLALLKLCDHLNSPVVKDKIWEDGRKVQAKHAHVLVMQLIATKIIEIQSKRLNVGKGSSTIVVIWNLVPAGEHGLSILTDEAWTQIKHH